VQLAGINGEREYLLPSRRKKGIPAMPCTTKATSPLGNGRENGFVSISPQEGSGLILVLVALVVIVGMINIGTIILFNTRTKATLQLKTHGQAVNVAKAGLIDALSWFRRQTTQPVTAFNPQLNPPEANDTDDPSIGLVREFELSPSEGLWARYEVRKIGLYPARDVSYERGVTSLSSGNGWVWLIQSVGIIFRKKDPENYDTTDFYSIKPEEEGDTQYVINRDAVQVIARAVVATEIRRLVIEPPGGGKAAICCRVASNVFLGNRTRVQGTSDGMGLVYAPGTGNPTLQGEIYGNPPHGADPNYTEDADDVDRVFAGMTKLELRGIADIYTDRVNDLPSPLPNFSFVYIDGNATFNAAHPLRGTGILFVNGNLQISAASNSFFSGIIYVDGQYVQHAPSLISGTIIATERVRLIGSGDYAEVDYDPNIVDQVLFMIGRYRMARAINILE